MNNSAAADDAGRGLIAMNVIDLVRSANPAAEAEVVVSATDYALTRFANSFIHQNVAESTTVVRLRVHAEGRTAAGASTVTGGEGLRALVERTLAAARLSPSDPLWAGLAPPATVDATGHVREVTILRGAPLFDEAALAAVRQWVYRPLLLNGIPTPFILTVTLKFSIQGAAPPPVGS